MIQLGGVYCSFRRRVRAPRTKPRRCGAPPTVCRRTDRHHTVPTIVDVQSASGRAVERSPGCGCVGQRRLGESHYTARWSVRQAATHGGRAATRPGLRQARWVEPSDLLGVLRGWVRAAARAGERAEAARGPLGAHRSRSCSATHLSALQLATPIARRRRIWRTSAWSRGEGGCIQASECPAQRR